MGKRGFKAAPARLKIVKPGDVAKREQVAEQAKLEPASDAVKPPDYLKGRSLEIWNALAPDCIRIGALTNLEVIPFADMCRLMETIELAAGEVARDGITVDGQHDVRVRHPAITIANQSRAALVRYFDRFGIGAAVRAGMPLAGGGDGKDPWEK